MTITYSQTKEYLNSFINYEKITTYPYKDSFKLDRIRNFLKELGEPQKTLRCIHIAGTKGKGSTSAFTAYILREAGFRTGLYTSPHLVTFRERIRILECQGVKVSRCQSGDNFEGMISGAELVNLVERLKAPIEDYNKKSEYGDLSFFEIYTALAFVYFKEKNVDFAVLETGLGGRLDATNTVDALTLGITPISYEHTQKLGSILSDIAAEKCGIIRDDRSIVITAPQEKEAQAVIEKTCSAKKARLFKVGKDIIVKRIGLRNNKQLFNVEGLFKKYSELETRLLGEHQLINASVAIGLVEALQFHNISIKEGAIKEGVRKTTWPGRLEVMREKPLIILDGAQNAASMQALKQSLKLFNYKRIIAIIGISKDKDIKGIMNELNDITAEFILTRADNPRAQRPEVTARFISDKNKVCLTNSVKEALALARAKAAPEDLILITGSLFVVGEAREGLTG